MLVLLLRLSSVDCTSAHPIWQSQRLLLAKVPSNTTPSWTGTLTQITTTQQESQTTDNESIVANLTNSYTSNFSTPLFFSIQFLHSYKYSSKHTHNNSLLQEEEEEEDEIFS
jgi:hypothetical protein